MPHTGQVVRGAVRIGVETALPGIPGQAIGAIIGRQRPRRGPSTLLAGRQAAAFSRIAKATLAEARGGGRGRIRARESSAERRARNQLALLQSQLGQNVGLTEAVADIVERRVAGEPEAVVSAEGEAPMVEEVKIKRGRFKQGLGNELRTEVRPAMIATGVQPTIDIGRFLEHEIITGVGVQFFNGFVTEAAGITAIIRIPAIDDDVVYIDEVNVGIGPSGSTVRYSVVAQQASIGGLDIQKLHFSIRKNHVDNNRAIVSKSFGKFIVAPGQEYVIQVNVFDVGTNIAIDVGAQAYRLPRGVWPLGVS